MFARESSCFPYQILHGFATMAQALESARSQSLGMVQWTSSFQIRKKMTKSWSRMVGSARSW